MHTDNRTGLDPKLDEFSQGAMVALAARGATRSSAFDDQQNNSSSVRGACAICDCNLFYGGPYMPVCENCGHNAESHYSLFGGDTTGKFAGKANEKELANDFLLKLSSDTGMQSKLFDCALDAIEKSPDASITEVFRLALQNLGNVNLPKEAISELVQHLDDRLHRPENGGISDDELAITFATQPYAKSGWCTLLTQCQWETNVCNTTTCFACS